MSIMHILELKEIFAYNLHRFKVTEASKTVATNIFDSVSVKEPV